MQVHPEDVSAVAIWMKRDAFGVAYAIFADVRNTPPQVDVCACSSAWIQRARIASESREQALLVIPKLFNSGEDKGRDKDKPKPKPDGQGGREAQEPQIPKTKKVE